MPNVSAVRIYALRFVYLLAFVGGLLRFWPELLHPVKPLGLFDGVAFSFWAALMTLMGLGVRYPLQMVPLLLLQLFYKVIWLLAVALPLRSTALWNTTMAANAKLFIAVVIVDILVIPWAYVLVTYVKTPAAGGVPV